MGARELLSDLAGAGVSVSAQGDRLVIRPASKLTEPMRAALRDAKPELLTLLLGGRAMKPPSDTLVVGWTDDDIARFIDRRARLMRWGWPEAEAEKLADRLVQRDRDIDDRVSCTDCQHYRPGRCGNHRRAGLHGAEVGRDLASLLQHCPGWETRVGPGAGRKSSDAPPHDRPVSFDSTVTHNSP